MRKVGATIAIIALLGILLWIAAEMHYGNCIEAAKAYPDLRSETERNLERRFGTRETPLAARLDGCSRLPF